MDTGTAGEWARILPRPQIIMLVIVGIGRAFDLRQWMLLELLHDHFDRLVELSVLALAVGARLELNVDIRRHTVVFHFPFALHSVDRGTRRGDGTAIDEIGIPPDSHQATPGAFAHQGAETRFAEVPRQGISARARGLVDDHYLRSEDRLGRAGPVLSVARCDLAHQVSAKVLD